MGIHHNKMIASALTALMLFNSPAMADWETWANGQIATNYTNGYTVHTLLTSAVVGPSFEAKWQPLANVQPINVTPPSVSVGCNGISINMGALSYLNFNELVTKLKNIASAAPAFAFKMAINTVCSQCSTIMHDLESVVDKINSTSLNSCRAAQSLGSAAGKQLANLFGTNTASGSNSDMFGSIVSDANHATSDFNKYYSTVNSFLGGNYKALQQTMFYGSLLNEATYHIHTALGMNSSAFAAIARSLYGDVLVTESQAKGQAKPKREVKLYTPNSGATIKSIENTLVECNQGSHFELLPLVMVNANNQDTDGGQHQGPPTHYIVSPAEITNSSCWTKQIKNNIQGILNAMNNETSMTQYQSTILSLPPSGYRFLNELHLSNAQMSNGSLNDFAKYITLWNLYNILIETRQGVINVVGKEINNLNEKGQDEYTKKAFETFEKNLLKSNNNMIWLSQKLSKYNKEFDTTPANLEKIIHQTSSKGK